MNLTEKITEQEKSKNDYAAAAQKDLNQRLSIIQQADQERLDKVREYQKEIDRREGAIDQLKTLLAEKVAKPEVAK